MEDDVFVVIGFVVGLGGGVGLFDVGGLGVGLLGGVDEGVVDCFWVCFINYILLVKKCKERKGEGIYFILN